MVPAMDIPFIPIFPLTKNIVSQTGWSIPEITAASMGIVFIPKLLKNFL